MGIVTLPREERERTARVADFHARRETGAPGAEPITVRSAANTYLDWLTAKNRRTAADTRGRLHHDFLPTFGDRLIASLTKTMLDRWLASMVPNSDDPDQVRRSKDSANRVLTLVKALLNHAMRDPSNGLSDDSAWRLVKPFQGVSKARDTRYTDEEVRRIIDGAPDAAVRNLIIGAYLCGARYGELADARVSHFDPRTKTLRVNVGKTGTRTIILQTSAAEFLNGLTERRGPHEFLLVCSDGRRWKKSDQTRPVEDAPKRAGLAPDGSIYALRHTYVSRAIEGGVTRAHLRTTMLERRRKVMASWAAFSWLARAARRSCGFDDRRSVRYANGATTGEINSSCADSGEGLTPFQEGHRRPVAAFSARASDGRNGRPARRCERAAANSISRQRGRGTARPDPHRHHRRRLQLNFLRSIDVDAAHPRRRNHRRLRRLVQRPVNVRDSDAEHLANLHLR